MSRGYREIEPEVYWTCPKDNKKFQDIHYRCRYCDNFVRMHEDINGLPVIGCNFLKDGGAKDGV